MKYKAVIFDLDGTLLDTIEDLADSMNAVLTLNGFSTHGLEAYKYFIGDGVTNLVRRALPEGNRDEAMVSLCLNEMKEEYGSHWDNKTSVFKGIPEMLDALSAAGIKMTVLSNKVDEFSKAMVAKLLFRWRFEIVLGERPHVPKKPDPTAAIEIVKLMGLTPQDFLYLGDTGVDMIAANKAGMYAVGALWGFRKADELIASGAKVLIGNPLELIELL